MAVSTTGPTTNWGMQFGYDVYGNRTSQQPTPGSPGVPSSQFQFDNNNRMIVPSTSYDANGNQLTTPELPSASLAYDPDNRISSWTKAGTVERYQYNPNGPRVWKQTNSAIYGTFYFYGPDGELLCEYGGIVKDYVYFGGRLLYDASGSAVYLDRMGSTRATENWQGTVTRRDYYPYGEEIGTPSANDQWKFADTYRDATTGLDHAEHRYYASQFGRLTTPDPSYPGDQASPGSWNLYSYVQGDPVNFSDPSGLIKCGDIEIWIPRPGGGLFNAGTMRSVFFAHGEWNALARLLWNEQQRYTGSGTALEHGYMAQAVMNRMGLLRGHFAVQSSRTGRAYWGTNTNGSRPGQDGAPDITDRSGRKITFWRHVQQLFNAGTMDFYSVLYHASFYRDRRGQGHHSLTPSGDLANASAVSGVLDREIGNISAKSATNRWAFPGAPFGGTIWLPDDCAAVLSALTQAFQVHSGEKTYNEGNFFPVSWDQSSRAPAQMSMLRRRGSHYFHGFRNWWRTP